MNTARSMDILCKNLKLPIRLLTFQNLSLIFVTGGRNANVNPALLCFIFCPDSVIKTSELGNGSQFVSGTGNFY